MLWEQVEENEVNKFSFDMRFFGSFHYNCFKIIFKLNEGILMKLRLCFTPPDGFSCCNFCFLGGNRLDGSKLSSPLHIDRCGDRSEFTLQFSFLSSAWHESISTMVSFTFAAWYKSFSFITNFNLFCLRKGRRQIIRLRVLFSSINSDMISITNQNFTKFVDSDISWFLQQILFWN